MMIKSIKNARENIITVTTIYDENDCIIYKIDGKEYLAVSDEIVTHDSRLVRHDIMLIQLIKIEQTEPLPITITAKP